jgi:plastocyanin
MIRNYFFKKDIRMKKLNACIIAGVALLAANGAALAEDGKNFTLTIKDHTFDPAEIKVEAGKPFTLTIKNLDATAEEFDSDDLKVEKVVTGNSEGVVHVHALKAGVYKFSGEYHEDTAHGVVTAE